MKNIDKDIQKVVEYLADSKNATVSFNNAVVEYIKETGMLYVDDRSTGDPLAIFHVDRADIRAGVDEV